MDARYNLGDAADFSSGDWLNSLTSIAQTYLSIDQQRNLDNINVSRASQGLPPINAAAYASGVDTGYNPSAITISPTVILIGIGLLVLALK